MTRSTRTSLQALAVFGVVSCGLALTLPYTGVRQWLAAVIGFLVGSVAERVFRATRRAS